MKRVLLLLFVALVAALSPASLALAHDVASPASAPDGATLTPSARSIGFGGHGALFDPVISPFDHDTMLASCDMGGLYTTHDGGHSWKTNSLDGVVWDIEADPSTKGTFYAAASGLWRSTDNGDSWQMIWPKPSAITSERTMPNHRRIYYFTGDSFPNGNLVEDVTVDPQDPKHILTICSPASVGAKGMRSVCESLDGGETFTLIAQLDQQKKISYSNYENSHVFVEHGSSSAASRILFCVPDGLYEVNRALAPANAATPLYVPDASDSAAFLSWVEQVVDAQGAHYIVLEHVNDSVAASLHSRERLWYSSDPANPSAKTDLTAEMASTLPRHYNTNVDRVSGTEREITLHDVEMVRATSMDHMYLAYRSYDCYENGNKVSEGWQGKAGLVAFDATKPAGERFWWVFGERAAWSGVDVNKRVAADANGIMERAHCDSNYTMLGIGIDPRDYKRLLLSTHVSVFYSPDITLDVGMRDKTNRLPKVNIYPRYATTVGKSSFANAELNGPNSPNLNEYLMRSNGTDVTVAYGVWIDPRNPQHLLLGLDDAGCIHSYDGGHSWAWFYTKFPKGTTDTLQAAAFDPRTKGLVYGFWHATGGASYMPKESYLTTKGAFCVSTDGGESWSSAGYGAGLPENLHVARLVLLCPRDGSGAYTTGESTIYLATMGHGFYVSHDSGKSFTAMNEGIPVLDAAGSAMDRAVWANDVMATADGRLFGITCYSSFGPKNENGSSTSYATQDPSTFGNVWEWDFGAGTWVRLPFNSPLTGRLVSAENLPQPQVRQPRAMAYDEATRTLWVTGVCVIGNWRSDGSWTNFGGGLYTYRSSAGSAVGSGTVAAVDFDSPVLGDQRNLTGVGFDKEGTLWLATEDGDVYVSDASFNGGAWTQVYNDAVLLCRGFDQGPGHTMYLTTYGVSAIELSVAITPGEAEVDPGSGGGAGSGQGTGSGESSGGEGEDGGSGSGGEGGAGEEGGAGSEGGAGEDGGAGSEGGAGEDGGSGSGGEGGGSGSEQGQGAGEREPSTPGSRIEPLVPSGPESYGIPIPLLPDVPQGASLGWRCDENVWRYVTRDAFGGLTFATGWLWDSGEWYYLQEDGALYAGWLWEDGWFHLNTAHDGRFGAMDTGWLWDAWEWYYLNPDVAFGLRGLMRTGWVWDGVAWYYLQPSGIMLRASWTPDGCYVALDGRWLG